MTARSPGETGITSTSTDDIAIHLSELVLELQDRLDEGSCEPLLKKGEFPADVARHLLNLERIDELLDSGVRYPLVRMVKQSQPVRPRDYVLPPASSSMLRDIVDRQRVIELLAQGASLIASSVDTKFQPMKEICDRLTDLLECHVEVNAFLSPAGAVGLGPHYDVPDSLIVQLEGRKFWRLHPPLQSDPLPGWEHDGSDFVSTQELELRVGDIMLIPRGTLHEVLGADEPSLHVSIMLATPSLLAYVHALIDAAAVQDELLRRRIPFARSVRAIPEEFRGLHGPHRQDSPLVKAITELNDAPYATFGLQNTKRSARRTTLRSQLTG